MGKGRNRNKAQTREFNEIDKDQMQFAMNQEVQGVEVKVTEDANVNDVIQLPAPNEAAAIDAETKPAETITIQKPVKNSKNSKKGDKASIAELSAKGVIKRFISKGGTDFAVRELMVKYGYLTKTFDEKGTPVYSGDTSACTLPNGRVDFKWNGKEHTLNVDDFFSCFSRHENYPRLKPGIEESAVANLFARAEKVESLKFAFMVRSFQGCEYDYDKVVPLMMNHMATFNIKEDDMLVKLNDAGVVFEG